MTEVTQYGFFVDTTKCTGCKTCMVACKDKLDVPVGLKSRRVYELSGGTWNEDADGSYTQDVYTYYASIGCNHCDEPSCVTACPTKAMHKRDDGFVHVNQRFCIGCESCSKACPYDAPQFDADKGVMTKCDGCYDRVAEGLQPSCVASCPLRALEFGPIDELRAKHGENADIGGLPASSITKPNLIIKTNINDNNSATIRNEFEVTNAIS